MRYECRWGQGDKLTCCQLAPPLSLPRSQSHSLLQPISGTALPPRLQVDDDDNAPGIAFDPTPMTSERTELPSPSSPPLYNLQFSSFGAPIDTPPSLPADRPQCQHQCRLQATPRRRIECHLMSMDLIFMRTNQRILCPDNFRLQRNSQKHTPGKLT